MSLALIGILGSGCDFFQELESLPEAGEGDEDEEMGEEEAAEGTPTDVGEGEPCTTLDDVCLAQDSLLACDAGTLEVQAYDCGIMCAGAQQLNFTCSVQSENSGLAHGCWCAQPNNFKIDTCAQVDECIFSCGGFPDIDGACTAACLGRTDAATIRLLGALYHCADRSCDALCASSPFECDECVLTARAGFYGDCAVERSLCDADATDEPSWP